MSIDWLNTYRFKREGAVSVCQITSESSSPHPIPISEGLVSVTDFLASQWHLVQSGITSRVLRLPWPNGGFSDYHLLDEHFCMVVNRNIPFHQAMAGGYRDSSGYCSLRIRLQGGLSEFLGDEASETHDINASFLQLRTGAVADYRFERADVKPLTSIVIFFRPEHIKNKISSSNHQMLSMLASVGGGVEPSVNLLQIAMNAELYQVASSILALSTNSVLYSLQAESRALELLFQALSAEPLGSDLDDALMSLQKKDMKQLVAVKARIEKDFDQHLTLELLSRWAGLNRRKLTEGFKSLFGSTVSDYLVARRMSVASELFKQGLSVTDVAVRVGYLDSSGLSKAFKRFFGVSPREYVKNSAFSSAD